MIDCIDVDLPQLLCYNTKKKNDHLAQSVVILSWKLLFFPPNNWSEQWEPASAGALPHCSEEWHKVTWWSHETSHLELPSCHWSWVTLMQLQPLTMCDSIRQKYGSLLQKTQIGTATVNLCFCIVNRKWHWDCAWRLACFINGHSFLMDAFL